MKNIEIKILNPEACKESEKMMVCAARLTQRGHELKNLDDFINLYNTPYKDNTVKNMVSLPHMTIQKFGLINIVVIGASRRFLAQITRHQNEVKFMSGSLQYSDYSDNAQFVIPYELLDKETEIKLYLEQCNKSYNTYKELIKNGINHDNAGYIMPQSLRNVLIISATPFQWKHMIKQRICRRNSVETRYVLLKIWELLYNESPNFFFNAAPDCAIDNCKEGKMTCKNPLKKGITPQEILREDFPLLEV